MFRKNLTQDEIRAMIYVSRHKAVRRISGLNGDLWYWPAEFATHKEGAEKLGIPYDLPPGAGDILV